MGQPVDRVAGVVLVTDYGALDAALAKKAEMEAAEEAEEQNWAIFGSSEVIINKTKYRTW